MEERAAAVIDEHIRPLIEADGGSIELVEVTRERVVVRLGGVCAGCPGQPFTVDHIIEPALRKALGVNVKVEARITDS